MTDLAPLRRALLSVSDKTGLIDLGKALAARGVELLSTGGSAKALRDAGPRDAEDALGRVIPGGVHAGPRQDALGPHAVVGQHHQERVLGQSLAQLGGRYLLGVVFYGSCWGFSSCGMNSVDYAALIHPTDNELLFPE